MSSVSGIRLPGLATGMDTEAMVKEMLAGEQNKVDKVKQKEQSIKWQQEIYREVIKDIQELNDKYFSLSSKNSMISSNAWNTLDVNSSNSNVITATGSSGSSKVDYNFEIKKLAEPAKATSGLPEKAPVNGEKVTGKTQLRDLGLSSDTKFKIEVKSVVNGKEVVETKEVNIKSTDTLDELAKNITSATGGQVKASFSEMTGQITLESKEIGSDNSFSIVEPSDALGFLNLHKNENGMSIPTTSFEGSNSEVVVTSKDGTFTKILNEKSNSFTIDGIKYDVHGVGKSEITSKQDVQPVVDNMKAFVDDYNKIMDKMYDFVTQKTNRDYPPLTEAQKKDMSEEEIERWEEKAKKGLLRNDSEMRRFMDDMQKAIFGKNIAILNKMGLSSHQDYNKKGQISLDIDKFTKALETNAEEVYEVFAKDSSSVMESMKNTIKNYTGGSSSVFAKKAGIDKTASAAKNFYSDQLKRQADTIKTLQKKMGDKESALYKKFGALEASMNKLNSQMSYFMQM